MSPKRCSNLFTIFAVAITCANALAANVNENDTAHWQTYRNPSGEFEIKYPANIPPSVPNGSYSVNGVSHKLEETDLRTLDPPGGNAYDGKHTSVSMGFTVQRGINPQNLDIQKWYESLAHRQLKPESEQVTTVGGRPAIHRGPLVNALVKRTVAGKEVSTSKEMVPDNTYYVSLNAKDVLTISLPKTTSQLGETYEKVLSTVKFTR